MALRSELTTQAVAEQLLRHAETTFITEYTFDRPNSLPKQITKDYIKTASPLLRKLGTNSAMNLPKNLVFLGLEDEKAAPITIDIALVTSSRIANHQEATSSAYYFALLKGLTKFNIEVIAIFDKDEWKHSVVVIGRNSKTDYKDPNTWNTDACVVDPTLHLITTPAELCNSNSVVFKKPNITSPVFAIRHCGLTSDFKILTDTIRNIQIKLMTDAAFRGIILNSAVLVALQQHFANLSTNRETIEREKQCVDTKGIAAFLHEHLTVKPLAPTQGLISQGTANAIRNGLNTLTKSITKIEWRIDLVNQQARLCCESNEDANAVLGLLGEHQALNAGTIVDMDTSNTTILLSPIPNLTAINELLSIKTLVNALKSLN